MVEVLGIILGLAIGFFLILIPGWCCCICVDRLILRGDVDFGDMDKLIKWTFCFPYYCCATKEVTACRRLVRVAMWNAIKCTYLRRKVREARERRDERLVLLKRWKPPQSDRDEMLAKSFELPKQAEQIQACIGVFKEMEKRLIHRGTWDMAQKQTIESYRNIVVKYLGRRLHAAQQFEEIERLLCCYHMDTLVGREGATFLLCREGAAFLLCLVISQVNTIVKTIRCMQTQDVHCFARRLTTFHHHST